MKNFILCAAWEGEAATPLVIHMENIWEFQDLDKSHVITVW